MSDRAQSLRQAFDASFARAPAEGPSEPEVQLLLLDAGSQRLALEILEIGGVSECPRITRLPGGAPSLLGLAGLRGAVVTVHNLCRLLDTGSGADTASWLVVCGADRSIALGFDALIGVGTAPRTAVASGIVSIGGEKRTVVRVESLLEAARGQQAPGGE